MEKMYYRCFLVSFTNLSLAYCCFPFLLSCKRWISLDTREIMPMSYDTVTIFDEKTSKTIINLLITVWVFFLKEEKVVWYWESHNRVTHNWLIDSSLNIDVPSSCLYTGCMVAKINDYWNQAKWCNIFGFTEKQQNLFI